MKRERSKRERSKRERSKRERSNRKTRKRNKSFVEGIVSKNKVVLFIKTFCPYCKRAIELLDRLNVKYKLIKLDMLPLKRREQIKKELVSKTGQHTVPNIFINGNHIGGFDTINTLNTGGDLTILLKDK